jgi:hypothetical protein
MLAVLLIPCAAATAAAVSMRLARFAGQTSLPKTPLWLLAAIVLGIGLFLAAGGPDSIKKWAAFTLPLTVGFVVLAGVLLAGKLNLNGFAVPRVWAGNPVISACGGVTLLGVMPALGYEKKSFRALLLTLAAAAGVGAAVWALSNFTLGGELAGSLAYPFHNALRVAKGGEMIGRVESFLIPVALCVAVLITAACMNVIAWSVRAYMPLPK